MPNKLKEVSQEPIHNQPKVEKTKNVAIQKESIQLSTKNSELKPEIIKEKKIKLAVFHKTIDQIL